MNRVLLLALLLSSPALGQDIHGQWLVYDIQEKEKFILRLGRASRGYGEGGDTTMGRRSLSTRTKLKYRVRGGTANFFEKDSGALFMSGTLNSDGTELSGQFASGGVFVAKKNVRANPVFQVVWLNGKYGEKIFCTFDDDDESSVDLECRSTGGVYDGFPQRLGKGSPANWLLKPNTFLDIHSCEKKAEEIMARSRCGLLRGTK